MVWFHFFLFNLLLYYRWENWFFFFTLKDLLYHQENLWFLTSQVGWSIQHTSGWTLPLVMSKTGDETDFGNHFNVSFSCNVATHPLEGAIQQSILPSSSTTTLIKPRSQTSLCQESPKVSKPSPGPRRQHNADYIATLPPNKRHHGFYKQWVGYMWRLLILLRGVIYYNK